jgi:ribosomal protein S18 acetylase RimI-like enzyme
MSPKPICEFLEWDTAFFGVRIGRIARDRMEAGDVPAILSWCREKEVECLYFLCAPDHDESIWLAEENGFHLVDIRVAFAWRPGTGGYIGEPTEGLVRPCTPNDADRIVAIAWESYHHTRFYYDPRFTDEKASALYREWARKSCAGWADAVLVAPSEGGVGGFVSCHLDGPKKGRIGLVGVQGGHRGQGIGTLVVRAAQEYFLRKGVEEVSVVTQGRNLGAQRLYQKCGFLTGSVGYWFHRWFPGTKGGRP